MSTENDRVFPTKDITKFMVRTKSAPLSATGCHEVIATFQFQHDATEFAQRKFGTSWHREYEIKSYDAVAQVFQ